MLKKCPTCTDLYTGPTCQTCASVRYAVTTTYNTTQNQTTEAFATVRDADAYVTRQARRSDVAILSVVDRSTGIEIWAYQYGRPATRISTLTTDECRDLTDEDKAIFARNSFDVQWKASLDDRRDAWRIAFRIERMAHERGEGTSNGMTHAEALKRSLSIFGKGIGGDDLDSPDAIY